MSLLPLGLVVFAAADDIVVELTGPQSDDRGHYAPLSGLGWATVYGIVTPGEGVRSVHINGQEATLERQHLSPSQAALASERAVQFSLELTPPPDNVFRISVATADGESREVTFVPDTEATTDRLQALAQAAPEHLLCQRTAK